MIQAEKVKEIVEKMPRTFTPEDIIEICKKEGIDIHAIERDGNKFSPELHKVLIYELEIYYSPFLRIYLKY